MATYDAFCPNLGIPQEKVDTLRQGLIGYDIIEEHERHITKPLDPFKVGKEAEDVFKFMFRYEPDFVNTGPKKLMPVGKQLFLGYSFVEELGLKNKNIKTDPGTVGYNVAFRIRRRQLPAVTLLSCANVPGAKSIPYEAEIWSTEGVVTDYARRICDEHEIDLRKMFKNAIGDGEKKIIHVDGYESWSHLPMEIVNIYQEKDSLEMEQLKEKTGVTKDDVARRMKEILKGVSVMSGFHSGENGDFPYVMSTFSRSESLNCPVPDCGRVEYLGDADIGDMRKKHNSKYYTEGIRLNSMTIHLIEKHGLFQKGLNHDDSQRYPTSALEFHEKHMKPFAECSGC